MALSQSRSEALCVSTRRAVYLYASPVTVTSAWKLAGRRLFDLENHMNREEFLETLAGQPEYVVNWWRKQLMSASEWAAKFSIRRDDPSPMQKKRKPKAMKQELPLVITKATPVKRKPDIPLVDEKQIIKEREMIERLRIIKTEEKIGWVYLVGAENGWYKIGMSKNVDRRHGELNRAVPLRQSVIHKFKCRNARKAEAFLHRKYKAKRIGYEWFKLSGMDVAWIMSLTDGDLDNKPE